MMCSDKLIKIKCKIKAIFIKNNRMTGMSVIKSRFVIEQYGKMTPIPKHLKK